MPAKYDQAALLFGRLDGAASIVPPGSEVRSGAPQGPKDVVRFWIVWVPCMAISVARDAGLDEVHVAKLGVSVANRGDQMRECGGGVRHAHI